MLQTIELLAVITSAIFGALLARRSRLDFVGVFSISFIMAFGGGTLRDLLLDRHPMFWVKFAHYPVVVFGIALVMCLPKRVPKVVLKLLHIPDAIGLGLFSVVGSGYAMEMGVPLMLAPLFGVITGTFGGVIGDVVCNEVPSLFRVSPLYATCSFVGCIVYLAALTFQPNEMVAAVTGVLTVVLLRFAALKWNLHLPELSTAD
jgi:uncharacterized membrane protein YeiH